MSAATRAQNAGAEEQPANITTGEIVAVEFRGNHALSSDELATVVTTKATHKILGMFGSGPESISQPTLERDTQALNQYYHNRGFIDAKSSCQVFANRDDLHNYYEYIRRQRLLQSSGENPGPIPTVHDTVVFTIKEGPPFLISLVSIEGLESLPNEFQPELTNKVTIKSGERWSRPAAAGEMQRLINILIENGYPNVHSDSIVVQNEAGSDTVRVLLYIHPGHRYKYGAVHIVYDTAFRHRSTITRNAILAQLFTDSGHWYKLSEIQRSEAALNKLGMFDLFRVSLDTDYINSVPDSLRDSLAVPVEVYLRMKQQLTIPLGTYLGSSTQGFVFGFTAGLNYKNLWQKADNLNFQASIQLLPTSLFRYSGSADYLLPYIGLGRIPLILGAGYSHQVQTNLPATDTFIQVTLHAGSSFILSNSDDKTTLNPDFLIDYVNTISQDSLIRALAPAKQINVIPSITYQDNRANDLINPTAGNILSAEFEIGLPTDLFALIDPTNPEPSSYYYKIVPQIRNYFDVTGNGTAVIATRIQIGMTYVPILDTNRYPSLDRRFYGGGAISNRGWAEQSLLVSANPQQNAVDGGFNDLEASVELRYAPFQYPGQFTTWEKFSKDIRIVLFYDIGNVWDNVAWQSPTQSFTFNTQALSFKMLAESIGIGLRYNLFFGALRIDWGFKLYDPSGRFDNSTTAIDPYTAQGAWLFNSHHPFSIANMSSFHFGIGQAF